MKATFIESSSGVIVDFTELGFKFGFEDVNNCAMVQMQLNFLVGRFLPTNNGVQFLLEKSVDVTDELMGTLHSVFLAVWGPSVLEFDLDGAHYVMTATGHTVSIR